MSFHVSQEYVETLEAENDKLIEENLELRRQLDQAEELIEQYRMELEATR